MNRKKSLEIRNNQTLKVMLAVLLPPLAVYLATDRANVIWLSVILTLLGWFPGVIHAMFVVLRNLRREQPIRGTNQSLSSNDLIS